METPKQIKEIRKQNVYDPINIDIEIPNDYIRTSF